MPCGLVVPAWSWNAEKFITRDLYGDPRECNRKIPATVWSAFAPVLRLAGQCRMVLGFLAWFVEQRVGLRSTFECSRFAVG